jgi:hypothetical protein
MKIRVSYEESIRREAMIDAASADDVLQRLIDGDDELMEEIEAVSYEVDGGGLTHDVIAYYTQVEEVSP